VNYFRYLPSRIGASSTRDHPRAYSLIGLAIVLIILAFLTAIELPSLFGNGPATPGGTTTTAVVSGAQGAANNTTAVSIADEVYYANEASGASATTAIQYAKEALSFPSVTSVTAVAAGAQFNFTVGSPVCITTPPALGAAPAVVACA
jgi:hypothetical protein